MDKQFNLIDEPWVLALAEDYSLQTLSLREVFARAHELRALAGELPTQDVAILRLLLAILYAVFLRQDAEGFPAPLEYEQDALDRWGELWNMGCFPAEVIDGYLDSMHERFWLFHPERPFYQVAGMESMTKKSGNLLEITSVNKLDSSLDKSSHKSRLFTMVDQKNRSSLSYPEAARWLINLIAYGDCAAKPSPKSTWLGRIETVYASGNNLWQTLMLNLVLCDRIQGSWPLDGEKDLPYWEKASSRKFGNITQPGNPMALLTLQARQILLVRNDTHDCVTGFYWQGGDLFNPQNAFTEQMVIWAQDKKNPNARLPHRSNQVSYLWRDFGALTTQAPHSDHVTRPGIIWWISQVRDHIGMRMIDFHRISITYGSMNSCITNILEGDLSFNINLLNKLEHDWRMQVSSEVLLAEVLARHLGDFAVKLVKAGKSVTLGASKPQEIARKAAEISTKAKERFFFEIDLPFKQWLRSIDTEMSIDEMSQRWRKEERFILLRIAKELVDEAGQTAFIGRYETNEKNNSSYLHCSPEAYLSFLSRIYTSFGGDPQ